MAMDLAYSTPRVRSRTSGKQIPRRSLRATLALPAPILAYGFVRSLVGSTLMARHPERRLCILGIAVFAACG